MRNLGLKFGRPGLNLYAVLPTFRLSSALREGWAPRRPLLLRRSTQVSPASKGAFDHPNPSVFERDQVG
jgi:hypothetical protein